MIDWVTCVLPCTHTPLPSDRVYKVSSAGVLEWCKPCQLPVTGSHESSLMVSSVGAADGGLASHLYVSGNPSKWLQGHNLFGSDDLVSLVADTFRRLCSVFSFQPSAEEVAHVEQGNYRLSRVDINYSFALPSRADVLAWIRAAEFKSHTRHGRPSRKGGTIYWGKQSRRWSFKAYCKGEEIAVAKHALPEDLPSRTDLYSWADNKLRLELCLRSLELKDLNCHMAQALTIERVNALFVEFARSVEMSGQVSLTDDVLRALPAPVRSTYVLWRAGEDCRHTLTERTYYRHRKVLLCHGIDIAIAQESSDRSNVVPLVRILEAQPAPVPEWAFRDGLVHHSARRSA